MSNSVPSLLNMNLYFNSLPFLQLVPTKEKTGFPNESTKYLSFLDFYYPGEVSVCMCGVFDFFFFSAAFHAH